MDNQRTILWAVFAGFVFLTWSKWQADNAPAISTLQNESQTVVVAEDTAADIALPSMLAPGSDETDVPPVAVAKPASSQAAVVKIRTDLLDIEISTRGGTIVSAKLRKYPVSKDEPDVPVTLLSQEAGKQYSISSGLVDADRSGPTHLAQMDASASSYELNDGSDTLAVPLSWTNDAGVRVTKTFTFIRGRYDIQLEQQIANNGSSPWRALDYIQISRDHTPMERSMFNVDTYSFFGPVVYNGESYEKVDPEDLEEEPLDLKVAGGWIASLEHHFLTAVVPAFDELYTYDGTYKNGKVVMRATGPAITVQPGEQHVIAAKFFVGPKLQSQLEETAPGLPLTVDYGVLTILAQPLFWLLGQVHDVVGNWGWSIILVTFMIKAVFYKLTETSGRSMAKMRKLQPRLKALQERYKDDRPALSQHMMELYKREKVNPAAGCLPMLIQIPFFISFYWVLLESVEMRQAPFALWITDLSSRDPFFVLPLLMGAAMFLQQKLNPAPPDPIQAKVMTILPIMFTGFFAFFPSGLVLYWLTNSVLSVLQQWNINRKMGADG
jgi:YidC/Oxa1 family membrane protein insertase